ncbi:MAG: hypothetical protein K2X66_10715, partial [Cyanobacteria bacterium]|nr:hypothetical protein [Cyanobacteriota bacterium]
MTPPQGPLPIPRRYTVPQRGGYPVQYNPNGQNPSPFTVTTSVTVNPQFGSGFGQPQIPDGTAGLTPWETGVLPPRYNHFNPNG